MIRRLLILACMCLTPIADAQTVRPEDRNAAIRYGEVFYSASPDLLTKASDLDMSKVGFVAGAVTPEFTAVSEQLKTGGDAAILPLLEASALKRCDFEIAFEKGIGVLMPHLPKFRACARLLRVDARRLEIAGSGDAAAERLAALVRMSGHVANDHILISSLVGEAICSLAIEETEAGLDAGKLSPAARDRILRALDALGTDDPFAMKAAMRTEQHLTAHWVKATYHGADAGKQLVASGYISDPSVPGAAAQTIALMNENQLHAAVDLLSPFYDKLLAVWDQSDSVQQLEALARRVEQGEYGPIGRVLAPAVSKARASDLKVQQRIRVLREKLSAK
jgi:hypothetical protein